MKTYRDKGIVLRTHKLGEADRIITILTPAHGQVRAVARGVRRTSSKFGARTSPFAIMDFQARHGRSLDTLIQVEAQTLLASQLAKNYENYTSATVMAELTEKLTAEAFDIHDDAAHYRLLYGAVAALAHNLGFQHAILGSYALRALAIAGWEPALVACAVCGKHGQYCAFSLSGGGVLCENCAHLGAQHIDVHVTETLAQLAAGQWREVADTHYVSAACHMATTYAQWQIERRLKSLPVWERGA